MATENERLTYSNEMDQLVCWESLRSQIDDMMQKVNIETVGRSAEEFSKTNLNWGLGLFCRSTLKSILRGSTQGPTYASLVSLLSERYPELVRLLVCRSVCLFKRAYCRNEKRTVEFTLKFVLDLANQKVVDEFLVLQILQVLIGGIATDDNLYLVHLIIQRCGSLLSGSSKAAMDLIFERMRQLLQGGKISTLSQKRITKCLQLRRDLAAQKITSADRSVHSETVFIDLSEKLDPESHLNYFHTNTNAHKEVYDQKLITDSGLSTALALKTTKSENEVVIDMTDEALIRKQKLVYLTIMSSMSPDEAVHKILKISRAEKLDDAILIDMIIKCCAQEKTYSKYYGVLGEKICNLGNDWLRGFVSQFQEKYNLIYSFEGPQLRNLGKLFGHLIAMDCLPVSATLGQIIMTEDQTSSASRVFIKFLFQEMVEELGLDELKIILRDETMKGELHGLFPVSEVESRDRSHLMFSINYFTAIGLGALTQDMRSSLNDLPKEARGRKRSRSEEHDTSSASFSGSRSRSFSRSRSNSKRRMQ